MPSVLWRGGSSFGGLRLFSTCRLSQGLRLSHDRFFFMPSALRRRGSFDAFGALRGRSFPCPRRFGAEGLSMPLALYAEGLFHALGASARRVF